MPGLFSREGQMDPKTCMSPPQSHCNPTTFGDLINTSLSQGVHLAGDWKESAKDASRSGMHQDQAVILPDGFPHPAVGGRAPPALQPSACIANSRAEACSFLFDCCEISCLFIKSEPHFTSQPVLLWLCSSPPEEENKKMPQGRSQL